MITAFYGAWDSTTDPSGSKVEQNQAVAAILTEHSLKPRDNFRE